MKKFIGKFFMFSMFFIGGTVLLLLATSTLKRGMINFEIPKDKTILVIGSSVTACAVDDSIVPGVFNISTNGMGYFYSYIKLREILDHNPHITTVILSYTHSELEKEKDKWFTEGKYIRVHMPKYLFLFDWHDFISLLVSSPYEVVSNLPRTVKHTIVNALKIVTSGYNIHYFGGYHQHKKGDLRKAKADYHYKRKSEGVQYSHYQKKYLLKIYELVLSHKKTLILLHTPTHPLFKNKKEEFEDIYHLLVEQQLPKATLVNHSNMELPEYGFADLIHLNSEGAKFYSEYLKAYGFSSSIRTDK